MCLLLVLVWKEKLPEMQGFRSMLMEMVWLSLLMQMKFMFVTTVTDEEKLVSFEDDLKIYKLTKFIKTNQETCINLNPAVKKGQKVKNGDFLTKVMLRKMVN